VLANGMELVSQSWSGTATMTNSNPNVPTPKSTTLKQYLDVEAMNMRVETDTEVDMQGIVSTSKQVTILNAGVGTMVTWMKSSTTIPNQPTPTEKEVCTFTAFHNIKSTSEVAECMKEALAKVEPTSSKDGVDTFAFDSNVVDPTTKQEVDVHNSIDIDSDHLMKHIETETNMPGLKMDMKTAINIEEVKAETPDASIFTQPDSWKDCKETPLPPSAAFGSSPAVTAFLKCAGMLDEAHSSVEVSSPSTPEGCKNTQYEGGVTKICEASCLKECCEAEKRGCESPIGCNSITDCTDVRAMQNCGCTDSGQSGMDHGKTATCHATMEKMCHPAVAFVV